MLCETCDRRSNCKKLCKDAAKYVKQDHVPQRELPVGLCLYEDEELELVSNTYLTRTERQILTLLGKDLDRHDICEVLNMTRKSLRVHIYNIRRKS